MNFKKNITIICVLIFGLSFAQNSGLKLWYNKPATVWNEALPIGNGHIAAMVFGDPKNEKLQLNEGTFWSGSPSRNDNPNGAKYLDSIRTALFKGEWKRAENLSNKGLTAKKNQGQKFQNIGNLELKFDGIENYSNYYRELDIENAIFTSTFSANGIQFKREIFTSFPDNVIVIRLSASKKKSLNFSAGLNSELMKDSKVINAQTLQMNGISQSHEGVEGKVKFNTIAKIKNKGGSTEISGNEIKVKNADEVLMFISMATNFTNYSSLTTDEVKKSQTFLTKAENKSYKSLFTAHQKAYQNYFKRVDFQLGTSESSKKPTDERIKNFKNAYDPELVSLYYQFGRYLLISSSQPGGQPANLQGIWNGSNNPAWDSKYTININTEMNDWPSEKTNLTELNEPLIQMVKDISQTGQETAKVMYNSRGWVAHHNTDLWRITGVVDFANAGQWPMGGACLSQHLYDKYLYNGDTEYLKSVYPVLESACLFFEDFLVPEPEHGWLVVAPSNSPENYPPNHQGSAIMYGNTMDNQILFDLFTKTLHAAEVLKLDQDKITVWRNIISKLPPMQIVRYGQLQEWIGDWDNPDDNHRHVSHLYGAFPSNQIIAHTTPELFDATRTVLELRGDVSTGWSMGWKVNLWAKLLDGNHAFKLIKDQLTLVDPVKNGKDGGTYPNMFDSHPPFQIDGNFGCTSGITEMLLQTQSGAIDILPALPDDWKNGKISGLRTYGGFEVDIIWENNKAKEIRIKSNLGGNARLRVPNIILWEKGNLTMAQGKNPNPFFEIPEIKKPLISSSAKLNEIQLKKTFMYDFPTEKGKIYLLKMK